MISDSEKEQVRQATDFAALVSETVQLKPRGQDLWGCCPFHNEKSPSFKITPSTGLWHCFGCGKGGDVFAYVREREHLDFPDAIRYLAERAGIELHEERSSGHRGPKRNRLIECLDAAQEFYCTQLLRVRGAEHDAARAYFAGRGFGSQLCRSWSLGYAPGRGSLVTHLRKQGFTPAEIVGADLGVQSGSQLRDRFYDRVMFPIHDEIGRCIAFGGRVLTDAKPKYLNTKETPVFHKGKHLFAFDRAKEGIAAKGQAIVCEGYTDVIAMHRAGFTQTVAALGTSFSADHVRALSRFAKTIICMFDGDAAGQRAAERAIQFIEQTDADLRCVVLPNNLDPMEFLAEKSADDMAAQLAASRPLIDFVFEKRLAAFDLSVPGQRVRAADELSELLAPLKNSVLLDNYVMQVANAVGASPEVVRAKVVNARPQHANTRGSARAQGQSSQVFAPQTSVNPHAQVSAGLAPAQPLYGSYPDASYEVGFVPDDYVPYDDYVPVEATASSQQPSAAQGASFSREAGFAGGVSATFAPASTTSGTAGAPATNAAYGQALSADERRQLSIERELLGVMANHLDAARPYEFKIGSFMWTDPRYLSIAWAMLALPVGSTPAACVHAAEQVVPEAASILAAATSNATSPSEVARELELLVDQVDFFSSRRQLQSISYKVSATTDPASSQQLLLEAQQLQAHLQELSKKFSVQQY